jgi:hypothetical protein
MKYRLIPFAVLIAFPVLAAESALLATMPPPRCVTQPSPGDLLTVTCPLPAASTDRRYRFKVDFAGGHDDTMAAIALTANGEPIACGEGSKTRLMGEDGDVSLECRFRLSGTFRESTDIGAVIKWSHAQYVGFSLVATD